jgi:hypothetical protein
MPMQDGRVRWWRVVFASVAVPVFWWGCVSVPETSFGDPTGLRAQNIPGEGGVIITSACEAGLPEDILDAGRDAEAGACKVSFANNLYPRFLADGGWKCSAPACHGGDNQAPFFDAASPDTILAGLRASTLTVAGRPYLVASTDGGGDPTKSSIYCNLSRSCGSAMPPSPPLANQEVCALETWLRCGAPDN